MPILKKIQADARCCQQIFKGVREVKAASEAVPDDHDKNSISTCNLSQLCSETDTHILGCCIYCYKNKRGAEYCRLVHKAVRETACCECEQNGTNTTKCRQEMHHDSANGFYMNKVTSTGSELPQCCLELQGLQMKCYSSRPGEMNEPYVTGYMVPYSVHNWEDWFQRFTDGI